MSFLQPILLAGLPLASLPIIIHLINRQRHRTIRWGAMMFLLDAKRMTRGMAKLRYWLIMAMRILAIAVLIFAISRPLTGGWLGMAVGGRADTTIIILDRSASMEQQDVRTSQSKRSTGLLKLSELMQTLGSGTRYVLLENTDIKPRELDPGELLTELPDTTATSTSADIPAMLQSALEYVVANKTGRTDIWICSDRRASDWNADDGRWPAIREGFAGLKGIRFYLLSYPATDLDNVSVRVSDVRRRQIGQTAELVFDIELKREAEADEPLSLPIEIVINGARSVVNIEMTDSDYVLQGHRVALDEATTSGWGRVELPNDSNRQDNVYYFVFAESPEHRTVVVSENPQTAELLRLTASSPVDAALTYTVSAVAPDRADGIEWDATSLILWQAPLPTGVVAQQMKAFVEEGRPIIFFPPKQPGINRIFGLNWKQWEHEGDTPVRVATWRGDSDLLSHTRSGLPLPVGELRTHRYCSIGGEGTALAQLEGGKPLLMRSDAGPAYFFSTLPDAEHSNLARQGVTFYVMIQRALSLGAATQGNARQQAAGSLSASEVEQWNPLTDPPAGALSSARTLHAGGFQNGDKLIALNRPSSEDAPETLDAEAVGRLFNGIDFRQINDSVGDSSSLASEIWRAFFLAMAVALLVEAWLCLPERHARKAEGAVA